MTQDSYRVLKFGGTSVGDPDRIHRACELIERERLAGPLAIVVSAMGQTTDWLVEAGTAVARGDKDAVDALVERIATLARVNAEKCIVAGPELEEARTTIDDRIGELEALLDGVRLLTEQTPRSSDLMLSFGERMSAAILALLLRKKGHNAIFVDSRDWVVTDNNFSNARVDEEQTQRRFNELSATWDGCIAVNTGFLGSTTDGHTTTLGRNGSDYTATLLARCIGADEVQIWTDVSGVMTADPGIVRDAYPIHAMSYMEAVELAYYGAKMFHPRTMVPLIESGIPMRIRNTMYPDDAGTRITTQGGTDSETPTSVTSLENLALLDVEWRRLAQDAQVGARVLHALDVAQIPVWMASQGAHGQSIAVVIPSAHIEDAKSAITSAVHTDLEHHNLNPIRVWNDVTLLSLVCDAMRATPNVAGRFFSALGGVGVNLRAIAQGASSRSISCVIDAIDTTVAVRTVHAAFNFADQRVSIMILGKGVVGAELINQLQSQQEVLARQHGVALNVVGIAGSDRVLFDEDGLELDNWNEHYNATPPEATNLDAVLERLNRLAVPILVDCTAADGMEDVYRKAFVQGVHVVAANKKPLTNDQENWSDTMQLAHENHRAFHYETTVGASLPVIETLKNLVRTGDRVTLIEGCLSGTLGYLTNELMDGVSLSEAVKTAKSLGYTEPQPQDDLSGLDVARKALILARELGLNLTLDDVSVEPLVPQTILDATELDAFFEQLSSYDDTMKALLNKYKTEGKSLRYLATIDPDGPTVTVGPVGVPAGHPATQLRGSEAFVAFTTERYLQYPLIVRGAGAGGAVTAAGVLADILKVAQTVRGR